MAQILNTSSAAAQLPRSITAGGCLRGRIRVPGDKSISHRALLLAPFYNFLSTYVCIIHLSVPQVEILKVLKSSTYVRTVISFEYVISKSKYYRHASEDYFVIVLEIV